MITGLIELWERGVLEDDMFEYIVSAVFCARHGIVLGRALREKDGTLSVIRP